MNLNDQRIGTMHRAHILDLLSRALGEGYIDLGEYEARAAAVAAATVMSDLLATMRDLPPQFQWNPAMPLPVEAEQARERSAARTAAAALIMGAASIPLAFCLIGVPLGIAAIAATFAVRRAPGAVRRRVKLARVLGAGGSLVGVVFIVVLGLSGADTPTGTTTPSATVQAAATTTAPSAAAAMTATDGAGPSVAATPSGPVLTSSGATGPQTTRAGAPSATKITVPNGVGMNYQQAQDVWRGAGLVVAPAHDATGAHRLPMIDSNWVVLAQDPPAGTTVAPGSVITATVKKYSDG